jgi:SagB-type dehydrogenase family enzyme
MAAGPRLVRRARALVAWPSGSRLSVQNFLSGSALECSGAGVELVAGLEGWTPVPRVLRRLRALGDPSPGRTLGAFLEAGLLVERGSAAARGDAAWERSWAWGPIAGAFHRGLRDLPFAPEDRALAILAGRARRRPPRPVLPPSRGTRLALPSPRIHSGVLPHLLRRESVRELSGEPLRAREVADVLFAGLGVRALVRDPLQGTLPLKLAPSGGARNPVEGYLYALRVRGVPRGAYRYSGLRRDLEPAGTGFLPRPALLLGGQEWTDGAAAVIFLVATFGRTAWKYRHSIAYRVVLLEAGHVAQNLLVAACDLGLAATPTCALSDTLAEVALGLGDPGRAILHAVVLGRRAPPPQPPRRASRARSSARGG